MMGKIVILISLIVCVVGLLLLGQTQANPSIGANATLRYNLLFRPLVAVLLLVATVILSNQLLSRA